MKSLAALNIKSSLLVTLVSLGGFAIVVSVAPVKQQSTMYSQDYRSDDHLQWPKNTLNDSGNQLDSDQEVEPNISIPESKEKDNSDQEFRKAGRFFSVLPKRTIDSRSIESTQSIRSLTEFAGSKSYNSQINALFDGGQILEFHSEKFDIVTAMQPGASFAPITGHLILGAGRSSSALQATPEIVQMGYKIDRNLEATVETTTVDPYRFNARNYGRTMAGLKVKANDIISMDVSAGEYNSQLLMNQGSGFVSGGYLPSVNSQFSPNQNSPGLGSAGNAFSIGMGSPSSQGSGSAQRAQLIEWGASVNPSKKIKVETAILGTEKGQGGLAAQGAKVNMALDLKMMMLNLGYSFRSQAAGLNTNANNFFRAQNEVTTLGFTFFLDPSGRYSLFLGNDYYSNYGLNQKNSGSTGNANFREAFAASFKGKVGSDNAMFFMNFRNQMYQSFLNGGIYYGLKLPNQTVNTSQYSTSIGLQYSF